MKQTLQTVALFSATVFFVSAQVPERLNLAGTWEFDGGRISLPGSTDEARYGTKTEGPEKGWLSRPVTFEGPVRYARTVTIPEGWRGRRVALSLERVHWKSTVRWDGRLIGSNDSLSTAHVYELGVDLKPGAHRLEVTVDNSYLIPVGRNAHSVTEHTQTNWNGMIGRLELVSTPPVWVDDVQVYPEGRVEITVKNATGGAVDGEVRCGGTVVRVRGAEKEWRVTARVQETKELWDEERGAVNSVLATVLALPHEHSLRVPYGRRSFDTKDGQFRLNGRPILLRATLECNIFPKTAYPPTDEEAWLRIMRIAREHGLNSFRFHSWCPPEAAFAAADRLGFLLYVELPVWHDKVGLDEALDGFMRREGFRILKAYGNHPSFVALGLGNELRGDFKFMDNLVGEFIQADPRRLFTFSADYVRLEPGETSEFFIAQRTKGGYLRVHGTRWEKEPSGTDVDYSDRLMNFGVPVVAHELGQWVTHPDYDEITKYTGTLKPRNLEAFRAQAEARGLAGMSKAFQQASGRFAWQLYKEDVEAVLRTPRVGGYQLLQLQDFPGQGEALIGLLDSFWDSKGILEAGEMKSFAGPTVALARFAKFVWTNAETLTARVQVAHYGARRLTGPATWRLTGERGEVVASGDLKGVEAEPGAVQELGSIAVPLGRVTRARRLRLEVRAAGAMNEWPLWVYPAEAEAEPRVHIASELDEKARAVLAGGGDVLLLAKRARTIPMEFLPVFWSLSWFPKQAGTMGIYCDPKHPALADFPTEGHSNWQWWDLTHASKAFVLDGLEERPEAVVRVIDDYHRNHNLAAVVEARVGGGRLLAVSFDLETDLGRRPAARQMRQSLLKYMGSAGFRPKVEMKLGSVEGLLRPGE